MGRQAPSSVIELLFRFPFIVWAERDRRISWGLAALLGGTGMVMIVKTGGLGLLSGIFLAVAVVGLVNGFRRAPSKVDRASLADSTAQVKGGALPFDFCFGCRAIIPARPCEACDRETEIFQVTSETDRRLLVNRLAAEGER